MSGPPPRLPDLSPIGPHEEDGHALLRAWSARGLQDPAVFERVRKLRAKVARQREEAERRRLAKRFDDAASGGPGDGA